MIEEKEKRGVALAGRKPDRILHISRPESLGSGNGKKKILQRYHVNAILHALACFEGLRLRTPGKTH